MHNIFNIRGDAWLMEFKEFIKPELLILIPVLNIIGTVIKKSKIPNKFIPIILGSISIILSAVWVVAQCDFVGIKSALTAVFTALSQGILIAGASVYIHQVYCNSHKDKDCNNK